METALFRSTARAASSLTAHRAVRRQLIRPAVCARCLLHNTAINEATPVAHPTIPGPPPQAPQASAAYPQDRLARKQQQAEALRQSQNVKTSPSKPELSLRKRFWKNVSIKENGDGTLQVMLDTRPVRVINKRILTLPKSKRALATSIAVEWDHLVSAQQATKQHYIPMTSIVSRAIDLQEADEQNNPIDREKVVNMVMRYLSTDTLLCWAPEKSLHDPKEGQTSKHLRDRQKATAQPIIAYLTTHIFPGVEIVEILSEDSIIPKAQPQMTTEVIRGWVSGLPAFELAALERGVLATKSLLIAVRLLVEWSSEWKHLRGVPSTTTEKFGIAEAAEAANLELLHQTEQWGEVEDTHDVDKEDIRRQLGSAILLVS